MEIPVHLDTSAISREMIEARALAKAKAREVDIPVGVDPKSRETMRRDVDNIGKDLAQRIRNFRTIFSASVAPVAGLVASLGRLAVTGGVVATALVGGGGLVGAVSALGASLLQAGPAAALLAPGMASLLTLSGTLKVGLLGVGDALTDAIGKDTFKKVSPQAERFVAVIKRLVPQLVRVRNTVQDRLFSGLADDIRPLAERYLPLLERTAAGVAATLNGTLRSALASLDTAASRSRLAELFETTRRSLARLSPELARIPGVLLRLGAASAPAFERLAGQLSKVVDRVLDRLSRSLSSGAFVRALDNALAVVGDLFRTLGSVLGVLRGVGTAASQAFGTRLTSPLAAAVGLLDKLVNSAQGRDFLVELFSAARPVLDQLVGVLGEVLGAVGRLFPVAARLASAFLDGLSPVIPVVEKIAGSLGGTLTRVLPDLSRIALAIGGALVDALDALGPVLPIVADGLATMAEAVGGGLSAFFTTISPLLPGIAESFANLAISLGDSLASALVELAPRLPDIADAFVQLAGGLAQIAPQVLDALVDTFITLAPQLPDIAANMADLAGSVAVLLPLLGPLSSVLATINVANLAEIPGALTALTATSIPGALTTIVTQFGQLVPTIVSALQGLVPALAAGLSGVGPVVSLALGGVLPSVVALLGGVPAAAAAAVGPLPTLVSGAVRAVIPNLGAIWQGALTGASAALGQLPGRAAAAAGPTVGRVVLALATLPAELFATAVAAVTRFVIGLARAPGAAAGAMLGVGPAIVGALAGVDGQAFTAGAKIVAQIGLGILSNISAVTSAIGRVAGAIKDHLPNSPVKTGPLRVLNSRATNPGGQIVRYLAAGMAAELVTARSAAALAAGALLPGLTGRVPALAPGSAYAGGPGGRSGPLLEISGPVYAQDPEEAARVIVRRQQDALAMYSIGAIAATGG